jgi:CRISPR-associated endonuclease/helicase Cas3
MRSFETFFQRATGSAPYGYQARLARDGLPSVVRAPTGTGKTGIVLAWLWRRLHGPDPTGTPRRLIFALPQRTLVEQTATNVAEWLANVGLADEVALHVVMGGSGRDQQDWRLQMYRPAIVVGTVDSLVSKALNRAYGVARATYPIDFALVTSGAQWVVDEIQLCPESTTTLRQLAGFAARFGTAEPFALTCMSATVSSNLLSTVDNRDLGRVLEIETDERVGELARRLGAARTVRRLPVDAGDHRSVADAVQERHRPGTLTLVVVNTVATARGLHAALRKSGLAPILLHSRFRGVEREQLMEQVRKAADEPGPAGRVVVSTQVVEAGVDLDSAVLVTEAAPWPSVVQRAGRCNRTGRITDAELWWLEPAKAAPYPEKDVEASVGALVELEGIAVTGEDLLARDVAVTEPEVSVIRRGDLLTLFDTAPDLTGADIDIAPYVRDSDDLDVQLAWAVWQPADATGQPPADMRAPEQRYRCRVPLLGVRDLLKRVAVWRFDQAAGRWSRVTGRQPARPGEVLVVAATDGGYDPERGFDPTVRTTVPGCPVLGVIRDPATGTEDGFRDDDASVARQWLPLQRHSDDTRDQVAGLVDVVKPALPAGAADAAVTAAYAHDSGKSHPTWQKALCQLAGDDERVHVDAGRPWAKSAVDGRLMFAHGVVFRHELASMLLLDGPLRGLLDGASDPDLVRYLVLAHHGKLRVQVRGPDDTDPKSLLGLAHSETVEVPSLLGQPAGKLVVDLEQFTLGAERSWTRAALGLRDRYGPFVLAYLETLVRIADWRASAGEPVIR